MDKRKVKNRGIIAAFCLILAAFGIRAVKNGIFSSAEGSRTSKENWDGLEKSIVVSIADDVQIGIAGQNVEMVIVKQF